MKTLGAALVVLGALGCSADPTRGTCVMLGTPDPPDNGFGTVGEPKDVVMAFGAYCGAGVEARVVVSIQDPNNLPLPLEDGEASRPCRSCCRR